MNKIVLQKLEKRENPVNIAIIGCGWWGSRVAKELSRLPNIEPKVLVDKDIKKCLLTYSNIGIKKEKITIVENVEDLMNANPTPCLAFSNLSLVNLNQKVY